MAQGVASVTRPFLLWGCVISCLGLLTPRVSSLSTIRTSALRHTSPVVLHSTPVPKRKQYGGGRTPHTPDNTQPDDISGPWQPPPPSSPSEARLTIVQVTDVYTLEHFASLKTLLAETRHCLSEYKFVSSSVLSNPHNNNDQQNGVVSMLTGDFLAPYLLSSVDRGNGMMTAMAKTPIDYLTWGNHEADVDHRTVCKHVRNWPGTWINSNMLDHAEMEHQHEFDIVEVKSPDGTNVRRIGLVGVLSDDPDLYSHFKQPGAFGGAVTTIQNPWETLRRLQVQLEGPEYNCDVIVPLQHTYVPDDHKTCREFDFPVVLSGHDHHRVNEVVSGTRLLKPGLDAIYATILELVWPDADTDGNQPTVRARFVKCSDWEADPVLEEINERAYDALAPLRDTELARVPPAFTPLSSVNSRGKVCSMGRFLCSLLRSSMNTSRRQRAHRVDAVLLMGGNIRGGTDYEAGSYFSLEALEAEIKSDESVGVVAMPGWLLAEGIQATHAGDPIPGWVQYDDGVKEEYPEDGGPPVVTHVGSNPIDPELTYRVATKISDLTNGQSQPWTDFYTDHPEILPPKGAYVNIYAELMAFFARNLWRKIWEAITPRVVHEAQEEEDVDEPVDVTEYVTPLDILCNPDVECFPEKRMDILDQDSTGEVSVDDIHTILRDMLLLSVDESGKEKTLAEFVHGFADVDGDGVVTLQDLKTFCNEMPEFYANQKWRLAFPRPEKVALPPQETEEELSTA